MSQFCLLWLICVVAALGQSQRGEIVGRVTDATGAAVPSAEIKVTNPATGITVSIRSNGQGLYTVPFLQYGTYRLKVMAKGFAEFEVEAVDIATASTTTVNARLEVAGTSSQVTVEAAATVLAATTSEVGTAVDSKLQSDAPNLVNGGMRNASSYIYMSPGVSARGQLTMAGGRTNGAVALMDGQSVDIRSRFLGFATGGLPSVEAIGEYKMLNNSMPAEYGRSTGGMTTFSTKSGTNQFHIVAYEYFRNTVLDARTWAASARSPYKQNEFGIAGGGPLILPKVYNGTNKTFFWANITGFKLRTLAASKILTVPTAAMRSGDFSAPDLNKIYDGKNLITDASGNQRQQFSCNGRINVICPDRISAVSKYFLNLLPMPSLSGSINNFVGSSNNVNDNWDFTVKADQYLTSNNRVSFFMQVSHPSSVNGSILGDNFGFTSYNYIYRPRIDWTYTITPNLVHQTLIGATRYRDNALANNTGQNLGEKAGIRGTFSPDCPEIWFNQPDWYICGNTALGGHPFDSHGNLFVTWNDSLVWVHGKHTVKTGIEWIHFNENYNTQGATSHSSATGEFAFDSGGTQNTNGAGGDMWASFLLGYPSQVTMQAPIEIGYRQAYLAAYVQDDWRATRRLTFNVGVRWDLPLPFSEVHGQVTSLSLTTPNPGAGNLPGALTFYGSGPGRLGTNQPGSVHWKNFGPRLGLAYQINSKTVFRAFAGFIYAGTQNFLTENADHSGFQGGGSPISNPVQGGIYYLWDTPYPQDVLVTPINPALRNAQAAVMESPEYIAKPPVLYMWSGGFQRQIKGNILLDASYLANNQKHGIDKMNWDQLNPKYWGLGSLLNLPLNSPQVQALGYTAPYPGFNMSLPLYRSLLPYPQFTGVADNANSWTGSTYNAMILKAQKRFSGGLSFLSTYTFSKTIGTVYSSEPGATPRDVYNFRLSKALGRTDMPQRFTLSYTYELPFGPGKRFFSGSGRLGKILLAGWNFSAVQQYQSGESIQSVGTIATAIPTVTSYANRVAGVPLRSSTSCSDMQFNNPQKNHLLNAGNPAEALATGLPLAYSSEGNYGFGNAALVDPQAHECGTKNEDVSMSKTFFFTERIHTQFGVDAFNVFNRHTWAFGDFASNSITSSSYGVIAPFQFNGPRTMQLKLRIEF